MKIINHLAKLFVILLKVIGCRFSRTIKQGYELYEIAIEKTSIKERINTIKQNDNYISTKEISKEYIESLLYSEDRRFYNHIGIDLIGITRAFIVNIKAGKFLQGGSTITQQLAKNMYFSFEKDITRKIAEVFMAAKLEQELTKEEIIELYVNMIYFGEDCFGIREATIHYYNVEPDHLTAKQIVTLVKTIKCPKYFNPNSIAA